MLFARIVGYINPVSFANGKLNSQFVLKQWTNELYRAYSNKLKQSCPDHQICGLPADRFLAYFRLYR